MLKTQEYPSVDSIHSEPFESIVELYYQTQGYITSSNKWFRCPGKGGDRDIDVLAVNGNETLIISVTINLDDKVGNQKKMENLLDYFKLVKTYLKNVPKYSWLVKDRTLQKILVYENGYKRDSTIKSKNLNKKGIKLLCANQIFEDLIKYVDDTQKEFPGQNLKTNNPLLMLVRLAISWLKQKDETLLTKLLNMRLKNGQYV